MKQTNLLKTMLLLCCLLVGGSAWADYEEVYTFTIAKNSNNNAYGSTYDVTIGGFDWNVPGNHYADGGLRIGGKNFEDLDRVITGKSAFTEAISKITFNHGGVSSDKMTVNSVTLTVASDADYNTVVDEIVLTPTIAKTTDGSFDFVPSSPLTQWSTGCYYKITINCTCTDTSSNRFLLVKSIVFYKTGADKTVTVTSISNTGITNTDLKDGTAAGQLTASVTAGGSPVAGATVTWESDDETIATIDDEGVVTLVGVGTATITATYAGDATYKGSTDTYDLTVTDTRQATITTINDSGLTNTDVYVSTSAGQLTASVTAGGSPVLGATVTWMSSNTAVATIDSEGNITLVKAGSTTITASYSGSGAYTASSETYELTVTDSNAPLLYESVSKYTSGNDSSTKITNSNKSTYLDAPDMWDGSQFSDAYPGRNGCFKLGASSKIGKIVTNAISLTGSAVLTFRAKQYSASETGPLNITVTGATATGNVSVTGTNTFEEYTVYLNNADGSVVITFATANKRMFLDEIKLVEIDKQAVSVSDAGLATYASNFDLDFTSVDGIEAYIAKEEAGAVKLTKVNKVPAGTGVLLRSTSGGAVAKDVPVAASADAIAENIFVRGTGATVATDAGAGKTNYVLGKKSGVVGFYKANGATVGADKAYLQTTVSAARINIDFDDATAIETVKAQNVENAQFFNVAGQRVAQPTKGLYIVNGKKVIIK